MATSRAIQKSVFLRRPLASRVQAGRRDAVCAGVAARPGSGLKRCLDLAVACLAGLLCLPLMLMIAFIVRRDSAGPALYSALRAGKNGKNFPCHKFRTMFAGADAQREGLRSINEREGPCFKIDADPRVTRIGHWLRRYSLDELPQFWNVLRGDMSMVGPRPHPLDDFARYSAMDKRRLDVLPGITGLWQVEARQCRSFQEGLALDLQYIETRNFRLDLDILVRTVRVVLQGSGV